MRDESYERWYNGLYHDKPPTTMRELVEDIIWATLTIDLGPNGNIEAGIDEGEVVTDMFIEYWVHEARELAERGA